MKFQEGEKVIHELKPEPAILFIWFFSKIIPTAIAFGFLGGLITFYLTVVNLPKDTGQENGSPFVLAGSIIAFTVLGVIVGFIYSSCLKATYKYYITNNRCVFCGGIIRRIQRSVPYHKVTDVEMSQNIIERMLGISTLNIFTPGTGSIQHSGRQKAEISFIGLKDNETPAETINGILKGFKSTGQ